MFIVEGNDSGFVSPDIRFRTPRREDPMGIPYYVASLLRSHKHIQQRCGNAPPEVDCLGLDFNCFLHKYLNADNPVGSIVVALEELLRNVVRAKRVYLAFDGLVPVAKIVQQRYRRMRIPEAVSAFDKHQLSPGTPFMREMADTLRMLFPQIVVSDTLEPGEGEHKIFQWLRTVPDDERKRICIYGLDADLVLIAIAQRHLGHMTLLREHEDGGFSTISVPAIVEALPMDADEYVDMALLCFGNDFMPNFAMFSLREDGYGRALYFWKHGSLPAAAKEEHKVLCKRAKETDRHIVAPDGHALEARFSVHCMDGILNWEPVVYAFKKTYEWVRHYFKTSEVLDWMWVYPYPEAPLVEHWVEMSGDSPIVWDHPTPPYSLEDHLRWILPQASLPADLPPAYPDELYTEATETRHPWMKRYVWECDPYISVPIGPKTTVGEYVLPPSGIQPEPVCS